jgi:hypothetical protein
MNPEVIFGYLWAFLVFSVFVILVFSVIAFQYSKLKLREYVSEKYPEVYKRMDLDIGIRGIVKGHNFLKYLENDENNNDLKIKELKSRAVAHGKRIFRLFIGVPVVAILMCLIEFLIEVLIKGTH